MDFWTLDVAALVFVGTGLLALVLSLPSAIQLCKKSLAYQRLWSFLRFLLYGFIAGYVVTLSLFVEINVSTTIKLASGLILMGGGLFVYIVLRLSLKTMIATNLLEENAKFASFHDSISSLPNYRKFYRELSDRIESEDECSLISIKYPKFSEISDVLGYQREKLLLVSIADRLKSVLSHEQILFDFGSCNFLVLSGYDAETDQFVQKVSKANAAPLNIGDSLMRVECHVGISSFPEHGDTVVGLLSKANMAAHEARQRSLRSFVYQSWLGERLEERMRVSDALRGAIANDELELNFQPIFESDCKKVRSVEVLVRWPQSDGSYISPAVFVPISEEDGTIHVLSKWVIEAAFKQYASWCELGVTALMNLNLSSHDIVDDDLISFLEDRRRFWKIDADRLVLEVTESAVMSDIRKATAMLKQLEQLGYFLAIDDFGTGYSSMSRLKELPIHHIKIDREFVKEIVDNSKDSSIVLATSSIAQAFGCKVTAEGVESAEAANALVKMGCDYLQGYYFSKPLTTRDATAMLVDGFEQGCSKEKYAA